MSLRSPDFGPADVWRWSLIGGYALIAGVNLPGHLSVDSVNALLEGRSGLRITWAPPLYSAVLGAFDRLLPGTGLYVAASLLLLVVAWATLPRLRPAMSMTAPALLVFWLLAPQVLLYQGIVWKDVLFANLAVAGFVALAWAGTRWVGPGRPWASLMLAWSLLATAALVRQNGAVAIVVAAITLGWIALGAGWRRALAWTSAGLAVPLGLMMVLSVLTPVRAVPGAPEPDVGWRLLQSYDLAGAIAEAPARPMPHMAASHPEALAVVRQEAPKVYSPVRSDLLGQSHYLARALGRFDDATLTAEWLNLIRSDPVGHLRRRLAVFEWVALTPELGQCLPAHVGVAAPPDAAVKLQLTPGVTPRDGALLAYVSRWYGGPLYSHLTYALLALAAAIFLLWRREPADRGVAGLLLAALAFAASLFPIAIACDYRYLYFLDLAAITGSLYVAIDPRPRSRPPVRGVANALSNAARTSA